MEINLALKKGSEYLKDSLYTNEFYESRLILSKILNKDMSYFITHENEELDELAEEKFFNILERRKNGEPLQYILGYTEFYGREFIINKNVLIPRNDTEISIEVLKKLMTKDNIDFLEIGVGSGIVSVTMALERPNNNYLSCDISDFAIENTKLNIEKYNLKNIEVIKSDLYGNICGNFDIIYSNPPYIKSLEIGKLQREVKDYEPILALDGGEDGLDFYKKIIFESKKYLKKDGFLVFEIGHDQGNDLKNLLYEYNSLVIKDLSNKDRVIIASKGEFDVRKFRCI